MSSRFAPTSNTSPDEERMARVLDAACSTVLAESGTMPVDPVPVRGFDFNAAEGDAGAAGGVDLHALMQSFLTTGFQASHLGRAVEEVNKMIALRAEPLSAEVREAPNLNPVGRRKVNCTIFLGYTSNIISSGVRETIRYLAQHDMVDCIVTTAGGVEEDFIKCLAPTFLGDFALRGKDLRAQGINRIGNLLVPNNNYCAFEDWITPILDQLLLEQSQGELWTPSKIIARLGKEINHEDSVYYWCYKNNIPVFSPALTDGSLGDMFYFHSYKHSRLVIDIMQDLCWMNEQALHAINTGMIILGGGVAKHHICNANLMRNGADLSVFVNTAQEYDGSDSGARPDEAVSWGKIKGSANPVKVHGDATIMFPLIVAETFARSQLTATPKAVLND